MARDLVMRGLEVTLIERDLPAAGATGRCHGLLHSGSRYAVKDPRAAAECASENPVIKNIAPHCVENTGGVMLAITEGDAAYGDLLKPACSKAGIPCEELRSSESPNPDALRCVSIPDAAVDPFLLNLSNLYDARRNGAEILIGKTVVRLGDGCVELAGGERLRAEVIVNASGHECSRLLHQSGLEAPVTQPDKGTILVTERRVCATVVSRMRMPTDGDIIVPGHTTSLIGTTSSKSDGTIPTREEYRQLLREATAILPTLKGMRIIRAFSGVRPLVGSGDGRDLSRDYKLFESDNILSIAGGKLTTYRLIAEKASDAVMTMLGERGSCRTKDEMLPDIRREDQGPVECRCESVGRRIIEMDFLRGHDISKFNRLGFGTCQGMRCARYATSTEAFLQERWKGIRPVLDESQLRQAYVSWASYRTRAGK